MTSQEEIGKCWWRYTNNGGRYKTCEANQYKKVIGQHHPEKHQD
jgi:hypothetical protein